VTIAIPPGTYHHSKRGARAAALDAACLATRRAIRIAHTPCDPRHAALAARGLSASYTAAVSLLRIVRG
jgi:hypothetical protein